MSPEMEMYGLQAPDNYFHIDDLLDFSNDDLFSTTHDSDTTDHLQQVLPPTTNPSTTTNTSNGTNFIHNQQNRIPNFSDDLCVPNDDVAELEWLSKFVDDSFSDFSMNDITGTTNYRQHQQEPSSVPGTKARSKRSRVASTHKSWISLPESVAANIIPSPVVIGSKSKQSNNNSKIRSEINSLSPSSSSVSAGHVIGNGDHHHHQSSSTSSSSSSGGGGVGVGGGRKCTHCASEKTPQWRTGPMGPKTLCNACGVRYKSGRLVPEYRPAASPTFVLTQHSNSHRKVMELRRQKEIVTGSSSSHHHHHQHQHQHQQDHSSNNNTTHEFFHHHDFEVC